MLTGLWGTGNGTTAYNENIGAMQITRVGSRLVIQVGAAIIMVFALIGARSPHIECSPAHTYVTLHPLLSLVLQTRKYPTSMYFACTVTCSSSHARRIRLVMFGGTWAALRSGHHCSCGYAARPLVTRGQMLLTQTPRLTGELLLRLSWTTGSCWNNTNALCNTDQGRAAAAAGKFGGLFASMPHAMVSGLFCVMFGARPCTKLIN